ncbi:MAG: GatB/YqeY domain-containing protein [Gammaproteobacteria bacterium]
MSESLLKTKVQKDMTDAMRAKDTARLATIRMLWSAIRQREIDERITLDDSQVMSVIEKAIKQRRDSIEQYRAGNRADLVASETSEMEILQSYLPKPLSDTEIESLLKEAIAETGAASIKDMGKVMNIVKTKAQGRVDMGQIGARIKAILGNT